jgi:rhodanese-related sulfurtransferase
MKEIGLQAFKTAIDNGLGKDAIIIDVRRPDECEKIRIKGSKNYPLDEIVSHKEKLSKYKKIYVYCAAGVRCKKACEALEKAGMDSDQLVHIMGESSDWKTMGLPVKETQGGHVAVQRQVYFLASSLILVGLLLSLIYSLWWLLLPFFIGAGMLTSAVRGICCSEIILSKMPWNR